MSLYDWLLALHVLAAFALVAALVLFSVVIAFGWRTETPGTTVRLFQAVRGGNAVGALGAVGTLVLGIWLAFHVGAYSIFDFWIIGAIVLWAALMETGRREGKLYDEARDHARELLAAGHEGPSAELVSKLRSRPALLLHVASCVLALLLLADMIWKPGA
jgi:ABC-type lipoprotein release transport system permease subunit